MNWISPKDKLPPQGKKILYFSQGDIYVVQRFGPYWVPIPFVDSEFSFHEEPELWADIVAPKDLTGKMHIAVDNKILDIDSFEENYPKQYEDFLNVTKKMWVKK